VEGGNMKKIINIAVAIAIVLIICIGCVKTPTGNAVGVSNEAKEIKIGWIGPLTGEVASFGVNNLRGVSLAIEEVNIELDRDNAGVKFSIISEDTQLDPKTALNAYKKLVNIDKVDAVMAPLYNDFMTIAPFAEMEKRVFVDSLDASEEIADVGEYVFGIGIYDEMIGGIMGDFLNSKNKENIAIVYANDDAFVSFVRENLLSHYNGNIVYDESYDADEVDFRTIIQRLKKIDPDNVVVLGYDEAGLFFKQAKELGFKRLFLGPDMYSSDNFFDNTRGTAVGIYFTFWEPKNDWKGKILEQSYKQRFGRRSDNILSAATGYDSASFLLKAMAKLAKENRLTQDNLKDELYITEHDGVSGHLKLDKDGVVRSIREEIFLIKAKGEFEKVFP